MTDTPDRAAPSEALLAHYLGGIASAEEVARVEAWAAADVAHREELDRLRAAWDAAVAAPTEGELRAARHQVLSRIGVEASAPLALVRETRETDRGLKWATWVGGGRRRRVIRDLVAVAAGIVLAVVGVRVVRDRGTVRAASLTAYTTAPAERATVTLSDGTRVVLAPATHLNVSVGADRGPRDVYLDGEALFTVRHDASRPFTVHTRAGEARDIGTTFGVRAYAGETSTRVVVSEGLVALRHARDSIVIGAGNLGRIDSTGTLAVVERVAVDDYLGWSSGRLVFNYTPLREALPELGRWYGLQVQLADSTLADQRISATFTTESPTQVLGMLGASLGLVFERDGQTVTVRRP